METSVTTRHCCRHEYAIIVIHHANICINGVVAVAINSISFYFKPFTRKGARYIAPSFDIR